MRRAVWVAIWATKDNFDGGLGGGSLYSLSRNSEKHVSDFRDIVSDPYTISTSSGGLVLAFFEDSMLAGRLA